MHDVLDYSVTSCIEYIITDAKKAKINFFMKLNMTIKRNVIQYIWEYEFYAFPFETFTDLLCYSKISLFNLTCYCIGVFLLLYIGKLLGIGLKKEHDALTSSLSIVLCHSSHLDLGIFCCIST